MGWLGRITAEQQTTWLQVVKTLLAIAAAWLLSLPLPSAELPIFAAIAALLVVAPSVNQSFGKGIERSVGVLSGVLLAWAAALLLGESAWVVLGVVLVSVVLARLARLAPMAANQVPISAMIMLALGTGDSVALGVERILETVIGAVCALAVNALIVAPVQHEPAERALRDLGHAIADAYERAASALGAAGIPQTLLEDARALRGSIQSTRAAMDALEDSTRMNPRTRRLAERIDRDERLLLTLTVLANRVIGMSRSILERYDGSLATDPTVRAIAQDARRIASEVRGLVDRHALDDGRTRTLPTIDDMLTSPIVVPQPHPEHWVLVGALLEDVRQARESLADAA